jgi:hypothetical protein
MGHPQVHLGSDVGAVSGPPQKAVPTKEREDLEVHLGSAVHLVVPVVYGLGDYADVGDAGLAEGVDYSGEGAEGNGFVGAEIDDVLRLFELFANFVGELVDVDGIVAEIDTLGFVDGDDDVLLGEFIDGVGFGDVDLDAGLQDRRGDHEDDEEDEDHVDEGNHVDFGEGGLRGFG